MIKRVRTCALAHLFIVPVIAFILNNLFTYSNLLGIQQLLLCLCLCACICLAACFRFIHSFIHLIINAHLSIIHSLKHSFNKLKSCICMFSFRFVYLIAAWGMKEWLNRTDWTDWLIHELFNRYLIIHSFHSFTDSFVHSLILYYDDCCGFRFAEKVQFLHSRCPMNGWMNKWINDSTCVDEWMIIKCLNKLMNQWMNKLIVTSSLYSPSSRYYHSKKGKKKKDLAGFTLHECMRQEK